MATILQEFFARSIPKAVADLETAYLRLPEEKRHWSPMGDARTAADQIAECAILGGGTADMLITHSMGDFDFAAYAQAKIDLAKDEAAMLALLKANTEKAVAAILDVPEADLGIEVDMPWGKLTLTQIMSYPYWNACYHEGQINYIASMIGCLE